MSSPVEASPADTTMPEIIKGKEVEVETQTEETLSETLKGGIMPHTRPKNKLRLKTKLRSNPDLAKEVIDVDNVPVKDLIINGKKSACSKKSRDKETKGKVPMETKESKK